MDAKTDTTAAAADMAADMYALQGIIIKHGFHAVAFAMWREAVLVTREAAEFNMEPGRAKKWAMAAQILEKLAHQLELLSL